MANNMSTLLNKIERRIGTKPINLPSDISKDTWSEVIREDTLVTFSRYFPHKISTYIDTSRMKNGYYLLDENVCESANIIGVRDINWEMFGSYPDDMQGHYAYGNFEFLTDSYNTDDVAMLQMRSDHMSMFNNNIFLKFEPPNMIKATAATGGNFNVLRGIDRFPLDLFVVHPDNLMTISPTKMEIFERLAIADVAVYLFEYLKFYDGLQTLFADVDLKLSTIEAKANERPDIVQKLEDSYVSASNENQPLMFTI